MLDIGSVVKRRRDGGGLSQAQLAKKGGVAIQNSERRERGPRAVTTTPAEPLARALGCTGVDIVTEARPRRKSA